MSKRKAKPKKVDRETWDAIYSAGYWQGRVDALEEILPGASHVTDMIGERLHRHRRIADDYGTRAKRMENET